jgi:hypothetical protein
MPRRLRWYFRRQTHGPLKTLAASFPNGTIFFSEDQFQISFNSYFMKTQQLNPAFYTFLLIVAFFAAPPVSVFGQEPAEPAAPQTPQVRDDFSDDELKSFVKASKKITSIQMETEQKMIKAIENEGLTVDRFHQILEQQRNATSATETSARELTSFNNAAQAIIEENRKVEQQMATSIEEEGIDIETYNQIMVAYQQNPGIQKKVDAILEGEQ